MALGSAQPLTEISTRNLPGVKGWSEREADNLTATCEPVFWKMWEPRHLTTLRAFTACYRDSFTYMPGCQKGFEMTASQILGLNVLAPKIIGQ
jgi:hypothetical protein